MSDLTSRKTRCELTTGDVVREKGKLRQVVVEARPLTASVRLKGCRTSFVIEWSTVYQIAQKMQAESIRREKRAAKRGNR